MGHTSTNLAVKSVPNCENGVLHREKVGVNRMPSRSIRSALFTPANVMQNVPSLIANRPCPICAGDVRARREHLYGVVLFFQDAKRLHHLTHGLIDRAARTIARRRLSHAA
jgi:hypothetical protein